jgi:uncharacterized membrane protein YfcA
MILQVLDQWPTWMLVAVVAATLVAGIAHGAVGFGFPLLSTPLIALFTDVRMAVLITLLPNILLNVLSVVRGADWRTTLRGNWPVAAWVLVGTLAGTQVLAYADPRLLRLLLAGMIVVYLLQARRRAGGSRLVARHPQLAQAAAGLLGGFFAGTVNVTLPPLMMYYAALSLPPVALTQALNLSFLTGRVTQAIAVAAAGQWSLPTVLLSLPLCAVATGALAVGFRLQQRIHPNTFLRILRGTLWAMAAILVYQVLRATLAR